MIKKKLAKVLGLALALSMLTGCGNTAGQETGGSSSSGSSSVASDTASSGAEQSDSKSQEATGEMETIKVMIWDRGTAAAGTSQEENPTVDWIREQIKADCNLNVEFVSVPRSGSDDKLNIMMSGGSAPDIVFTYDQSIFTNYATNGGLADLSEAYAQHGTQIQEISGDIQSMGQIDGKQYAIMKQREASGARHMAYIRKDWLDVLNMEVPTTKEELFACLYAFKEQNPGNVDNVVPWAMGGSTDTARFYLNFVGSYVPQLSDKDAFVYSEEYLIFADGAVDGIRKLNELYNDGIISKDFVTDTTIDLYQQDITSGRAGFLLCDRTNPTFTNIPVLKATVEGAELVPVNCFELPDGTYRNPAEPMYGMFIMVPKTSQDKADAVMKYLNWMVNPEVAENLSYTPEHKTTEEGIPVWPTEDELKAGSYPGNGPDYNIMNDRYDYWNSKDSVVASLMASNDWESKEYFENFYELTYVNGHYVYPTYPAVIETEANYGANVKKTAIEYVYKLICCDPASFDATQKEEYQKLVSSGLEKILEERAAWYDANVTN